MREDLQDAYSAVDWAVAQLPVIEKAFEAWIEATPYLIVEEPHPEMGQKLFKLEINRRLPGTVNASVGAVINSIRSSLDLLASALAIRNGKSPSAERHFPIYASIDTFRDPKNVAKREKWLSLIEMQILEELKPYRGGDDLLFVLHQLDVLRKHEKLITVHLLPSSVIISPEANAAGFRFPHVWPGFKEGAIIGWTDINAANSDFHIAVEITFNEPGLLVAQPLIPTLRKFGGMADSIIQRFERT